MMRINLFGLFLKACPETSVNLQFPFTTSFIFLGVLITALNNMGIKISELPDIVVSILKLQNYNFKTLI